MEVDSGLSLACSVTVLALVSTSLVLLNVAQTLTLKALLSLVVWIKAITCAAPLAASIFLLVPLLSGPVVVHKSRLAMLASLVRRPSALLTISLSGAALHYFLPVLNPIVNVDVATSPLTAYLVCSGLYSGVSFYLRLMYAESPALNYPTFRIGWSTRLMLSLRQLVSTSFLNAQRSFKVFFIIWIGVTLVFSLQIWPLMSPLFQLKICMLFCLSQFLLSLCLSVSQCMATNSRYYQMDTAVVGEESIIQLIRSKDTFKRAAGLQELAILSRYADPRRAQIYQLSVPGGKPRTWDAIWGEGSAILAQFVKRMDQINQPEKKTKNSKATTPEKMVATTTTMGGKEQMATPKSTVRNRFGDLHLWTKDSTMRSPQRASSTQTLTETQKSAAESAFLEKSKEEKTPVLWRLVGGILAMVLAVLNAIFTRLKFPINVSVGLQSIRPINYLIAEREEYKILCLVADVNCTRLAVIALANIFAAAPTEDHYGVTQLGLKSALGLFNRLVKGLDIIVRNNQKRNELRKLRNEVKTALGKVTSAYGDSLNEI